MSRIRSLVSDVVRAVISPIVGQVEEGGGGGTSGYTDFSEYGTGVQPSDWSIATGDAGWTVVADGAATGGKVLHRATSGQETSLVWDGAGSSEPGDGVQEVVARVKMSFHASNASVGVCLRNDGAGNLTYCNTDDKNNVLNPKWGTNSITTFGFTIATGTWYWVRFRVDGQGIQAKIWAGAAGDEGAGWDIDTSYAIDENPGPVGVVASWFKVMDVDVFGWASGGGTAPKS